MICPLCNASLLPHPQDDMTRYDCYCISLGSSPPTFSCNINANKEIYHFSMHQPPMYLSYTLYSQQDPAWHLYMRPNSSWDLIASANETLTINQALLLMKRYQSLVVFS